MPHPTSPISPAEVFPVVRRCVARAVNLPPSTISPTDTLLGEIGAGSMDVVELMFRLEQMTGVVQQHESLTSLLLDGVDLGEFACTGGELTESGRVRVLDLFPQWTGSTLSPGITVSDVLEEMTPWTVAIALARRINRAGVAR